MEKPPTVPQGTRKDPPRIKGRDGKNYPGQRNTKAPHASLDDRQVARMVDDLMRHAWMWSERHWQAFKLVVQNIDTTRQQGNHPLKEGRSSPEDNARWQRETRKPLDSILETGDQEPTSQTTALYHSPEERAHGDSPATTAGAHC